MSRDLSKGLFFSVSSGLLLTLAFPRWNLSSLAWVALVPLLKALDESQKRREAFLFAFMGGLTFFLLSIAWLRHVAWFGLFFVAVLQAFYWGVFGFFNESLKRISLMGAALLWVVLEVVRAEIPVWGFGWNLLGTSQAANLWIAQLASVGGVYSVSFLVFTGNQVCYFLWKNGWRKGRQTLLVFFFLIAAAASFGWSRAEAYQPQSFLPVAALQGNIPQALKWDENFKRQILRIYLNLTQLAAYDRPRLILWPEAAYPGFFNRELLASRIHKLVRRLKIPTLIGSPHAEVSTRQYFNSVYLLDESGEIRDRYDKILLVPFGEYVPWKPVFGFLERYAYGLGVSDFSAGKRRTLFPLAEGVRFGVLICFEDTFPNLARKFVRDGADFLAVVTNDAWFGRSGAPYQHLQASVFRAIENGVSVVRAANTGVSAFITPVGRVGERVRNKEGKDTFIMGGMTYPLPLTGEKTFYQRGGWIFSHACLVIFLIIGLVNRAAFRKKSSLILLLLVFFFELSACIRLQGGAFYAKKSAEDELPQVKEAYFDTDEIISGQKGAPGRIQT